jgi:hypothetical protein
MSINNCIADQGPIVSTLLFGFLFLVSEGLPFLGTLEGNGIIHEIITVVKKRISLNRSHSMPVDDIV